MARYARRGALMIAMEFRCILIGLPDAPTNAHGCHNQYAQRLQLMLRESHARNLSITLPASPCTRAGMTIRSRMHAQARSII
jgi:hypothetical protein